MKTEFVRKLKVLSCTLAAKTSLPLLWLAGVSDMHNHRLCPFFLVGRENYPDVFCPFSRNAKNRETPWKMRKDIFRENYQKTTPALPRPAWLILIKDRRECKAPWRGPIMYTLYVYVRVYTYRCVYICIYIYIYIYVYIHTHTYLHTYIYTYVYIHIILH